MNRYAIALVILLAFVSSSRAEVGDAQIRTDHPWYPGELAFSTFDRLFATQAKAYERSTGVRVESDEQKALASWYWRNTHYWHGEAGRRDLWGEGLGKGKDRRLREYWNGLFGYGFGLCGTTHSQWTAEFEHLLGHGRSRGVGAAGHNAFEVFLQGGAYGEKGKWALLDHDLSTVIFNQAGDRLLGLGELQNDVGRWIRRDYLPERQRGWLVCGLHPSDGNSYRKYAVAEYLAGYAGPPPMVRLRRGERMRRYFEPGLDDGKTFVFWGRNYNTNQIPGPERSRTWVNQPERMHGSTSGTQHRNGQVRFANVEYRYRPNFVNGDYREGIVDESDEHVVFAFQTPYVIGATPPNDNAWGVYETGCRNGLVIRGDSQCDIAISTNAGRTWQASQKLTDGVDLTDFAKGRSQYWLRFTAGRGQLRSAGLEMTTVCQANAAVLPRLRDNGSTIRYEASGQSVYSMGPELDLATTFLSHGEFGGKTVTLAAKTDRPVVAVYASAHVASGSPPNPDVQYQIEYRLGADKPWLPVAKNWKVSRRGDEPDDFWSQSFCYGSVQCAAPPGNTIQVRFRNDGGKRYLRAEVHFIQRAARLSDPLKVTYDWADSSGQHRESHVFSSKGQWRLATGNRVETRWVEFEPVP
jgi:hypothetical protein